MNNIYKRLYDVPGNIGHPFLAISPTRRNEIREQAQTLSSGLESCSPVHDAEPDLIVSWVRTL